MNKREEIIRSYFQCWINNDCEILNDISDDQVVYSECYGPEYIGIDVIRRWFEDWNKCGTVLVWDIKQLNLY